MQYIILLCLISIVAGIPAFPDFLKRAEKPQVKCSGIEPKYSIYNISSATPYPNYYRWPDGIIPYDFSPEMATNASDAYLRNLVRKAMKEIERETDNCIKFVKRKSAEHDDWVRIVRGEGCNSCVGKQHFFETGKSLFGEDGLPQLLSLDFGCENKQIIMHELLHAAGLTHEHQRPDRDEHIIINEDCLGENDPLKNYHVLYPNQITCFTPFDMESIMLYGTKAFYGKSCITDLEGNTLIEVYKKKGMSASDIKRVKILYGCDGEIDTMSKKLCYQRPT